MSGVRCTKKGRPAAAATCICSTPRWPTKSLWWTPVMAVHAQGEVGVVPSRAKLQLYGVLLK
jgi:hypothetical protein